MNVFRKTLAAGALLLGSLGVSLPASASTIVDLAFALDRSGSIGLGNYITAKNGLANALNLIPTTGDVQYRVGVVSFGGSASPVFEPEIITADNKATLISAVQNSAYTGGGTDTAGAVNLIRSLFPATLGKDSLINIITDGSPNSTSALATAVTNAAGDGWDGLSYEVIGTSNTTASVLNTAFPGTPVVIDLAAGDSLDDIPNPLTTGFVIQISGFADFEAAIGAKVQRIVDDTGGGEPGAAPIPLPAAGWLLISAIGGLAVMRRRQRALAA